MRHARKDVDISPDGKPDVGFYEFLKLICETGPGTKSDLCRSCYKKKPLSEDPDDEDTIYCSKACGLRHALARLNGEDFGGEIVEAVEPVEVEEPLRPVTPMESAVENSKICEGDEGKSASSRLCLRLVELGDDDDLTIENLLATIEDDDEDSFDDSEPRSSGSHQFSSVRQDSTIIDYERPKLDLFKHAVRRSLALSVGDYSANHAIRESTIEADCATSLKSLLEEPKQEIADTPVSSTGVAPDEVPTGEPENDPNVELDRSPSFGLASRLRKALNRFSSTSRRNHETDQTPESPKKVEIINPPESPHFVTRPTGDDWNDFVNILQFMERTSLGGSPEKRSWK